MYAPFSADVENIDLSLNHWQKARGKYLKRYSHRITADFLQLWEEKKISEMQTATQLFHILAEKQFSLLKGFKLKTLL